VIRTRKPTGLPSWPLVLLAGGEGSGKSFQSALASASALVDRTFWLGHGEQRPDEYGAIPGADFDIVEYDGSIAELRALVHEIVDLARGDRPNLIVIDSGTKVWGTISENAQLDANRRAKKDDAVIGVDLWNKHKADWRDIIDTLRRHDGPAIITARYGEVAEVVKGKPTGEKLWSVRAEKDLAFDVDAVVLMRERGSIVLSKVRSVRYPLAEPREYPDFTLDDFWRKLGLADGPTGKSDYDAPTTDAPPSDDSSGRDWLGDVAKADTLAAVQEVGAAAAAAGAGRDVMNAIRARSGALAKTPAGSPPTG